MHIGTIKLHFHFHSVLMQKGFESLKVLQHKDGSLFVQLEVITLQGSRYLGLELEHELMQSVELLAKGWENPLILALL